MGRDRGLSQTSKIDGNWPKGAEHVGLPAVDGHEVTVRISGLVRIGCKAMYLSEWAAQGRRIAADNGVEVNGGRWFQ